jgi:hypothetical protein
MRLDKKNDKKGIFFFTKIENYIPLCPQKKRQRHLFKENLFNKTITFDIFSYICIELNSHYCYET